jgi:hypothetical protein
MPGFLENFVIKSLGVPKIVARPVIDRSSRGDRVFEKFLEGSDRQPEAVETAGGLDIQNVFSFIVDAAHGLDLFLVILRFCIYHRFSRRSIDESEGETILRDRDDSNHGCPICRAPRSFNQIKISAIIGDRSGAVL